MQHLQIKHGGRVRSYPGKRQISIGTFKGLKVQPSKINSFILGSMDSCLLPLFDIFGFCLSLPSPRYLALCLAPNRGLVKISQLNQRKDNLILDSKSQLTYQRQKQNDLQEKYSENTILLVLQCLEGVVAGDWESNALFFQVNCFFKKNSKPHLFCFLNLMVLWELNQLIKGHWKRSFLLTPVPSHGQLFITEARGSTDLSQCINFYFQLACTLFLENTILDLYRLPFILDHFDLYNFLLIHGTLLSRPPHPTPKSTDFFCALDTIEEVKKKKILT